MFLVSRIILWRHGQTPFNAQKRLQGQIDVPLSDLGREQAEMASRVLAKYGVTHIVSSDLSRAKSTGNALAEKIGLTVEQDSRFRERSFGLWEGLNADEIKSKWSGEYEKWLLGEVADGVQIEPIAQVGSRFADGVNYYAEKYGEDSVIVIASHGSAISKALLALLGLSFDFRGFKIMNNCAWAVLDKAYSGDWVLSGYNLSADK